MAYAEDSELFIKVNEVIAQVRPYLQNDGGDIELIEVTDDKVVNVKLKGACGACPFSLQTLKQGVEQAVQKVLPEIKSVERVD